MNKIVSFLNTEKMVKNSFYLTYVFLLTTATITFIEAMRTKNNRCVTFKFRNMYFSRGCIFLWKIC